MYLLGDSNEMRRCFVNTDELLLGPLVPVQFPMVLLSVQLPAHR